MIEGKNAQGKTSILEALYLVTQLKSFRTSKLSDLILHGKQEASVSCELIKPFPTKILFGFDQKKKNLQIDSKPISSRSKYEFLGTSVSFSPDDLSLIKGGPELRRSFIDDLVINLDPNTATQYGQFEKALTQRNRLLRQIRDGEGDASNLDLWNEIFVREAVNIYSLREQVLVRLNKVLGSIYERLFGSNEQIQILYQHQFENKIPTSGEFLERISRRREAEMAVGYSLIGPHRDDLDIQINGLSSRSFASQGQCRSLVIALKVAQLELTKEAQKMAPLLLLDDIISELDDERVHSLLSYLSSYPGQMFLTTVEQTKIEKLSQNFADFHSFELGLKAVKSA